MKSLLIVRTFCGADYEARTRYLHLAKVEVASSSLVIRSTKSPYDE